jgi:hypothetical protein
MTALTNVISLSETRMPAMVLAISSYALSKVIFSHRIRRKVNIARVPK